MGAKGLTRFKKIGVDTNCFIYLFEENPKYEPICRQVFNLAGQGELDLVTSIITVAEVLVKPRSEGNRELEFIYNKVFQATPNLEIFSLDYLIANRAADLKARYGINLADAFQLAVCWENEIEVFLSNDAQLKKVKEVKVLLLDEFID
jgi:predicted nucleic acid-binding protein